MIQRKYATESPTAPVPEKAEFRDPAVCSTGPVQARVREKLQRGFHAPGIRAVDESESQERAEWLRRRNASRAPNGEELND